MKKIIAFIIIPVLSFSQGYTSYFTGNATNVVTTPQFGVCLMGGATENDNAMKWLLQKANGGDVVVIRSSGSNGYNNYLFSELGIPVNSVETLVITSVAGAINPYVLDKVANAEMIWFAGGDQWNYISYFKDNALEDVLNNHINVKNAPIGGTSAGMAILGGRYFSAQNGSVTSSQAMANPYASNVTVGGYSATNTATTDFLNVPLLANVITDTHFDNPNRKGRLVTFLARINATSIENNYGIACNEYTAVCIDGQGNSQVFGDYPNYQEFAYFVIPNCSADNNPETLDSNTPLSWNYAGNAISSYKVAGLPNGSPLFNVNSLFLEGIGLGGEWKNWTVNNGVFNEADGNASPTCLLNNTEFSKDKISISPNPVDDYFTIDGVESAVVSIYDAQGRSIKNFSINEYNGVNIAELSKGIYLVKIESEGKFKSKKIIKL